MTIKARHTAPARTEMEKVLLASLLAISLLHLVGAKKYLVKTKADTNDKLPKTDAEKTKKKSSQGKNGTDYWGGGGGGQGFQYRF